MCRADFSVSADVPMHYFYMLPVEAVQTYGVRGNTVRSASTSWRRPEGLPTTKSCCPMYESSHQMRCTVPGAFRNNSGAGLSGGFNPHCRSACVKCAPSEFRIAAAVPLFVARGFLGEVISMAAVRSTPVWLARHVSTHNTSAISSARLHFSPP